MGLCSDSIVNIECLVHSLDYSLIPCREKAVSVLVYPDRFSSNQDRVGPPPIKERLKVG